MSDEICSCCGERIEDEEIKSNYEGAGLEPELRQCRNCLENPVEPVKDLFERIGETLGEDNQEQWRGMDTSLKAAFALKCIKDGAIEGGTVGHIETLRTMAASGI